MRQEKTLSIVSLTCIWPGKYPSLYLLGVQSADPLPGEVYRKIDKDGKGQYFALGWMEKINYHALYGRREYALTTPLSDFKEHFVPIDKLAAQFVSQKIRDAGLEISSVHPVIRLLDQLVKDTAPEDLPEAFRISR